MKFCNMNNPFFSVCIPVYNRESTIYNTLCSVANQTFRDFEVIVVENGSKDNSRAEVERFFKSKVFKEHEFPYRYLTNDWSPKAVEDWNEPIKLAKGDYVAMLEGDDQYGSHHLEHAYEILSSKPNIGVYADGSQIRSRIDEGVILSDSWLQRAKRMIDPAPPSESIFKRVDNTGNPFFYDDVHFEYSPECELYVRIALKGFDLYNASYREIYREKTGKKKVMTWHYFTDRFTLLVMYRNLFNKNEYKSIIKEETVGVLGSIDKSFGVLIPCIKELIKKTSLLSFISSFNYYCLGYITRKIRRN